MDTFHVWAIALAVYALFLAWYVNWRGALSPAEVETFMARLAATDAGDNGRNALETLRRFLSEDDGREFFMLNVVRLATNDVPDPVTGQPRPPREVMAGYTKMFLPALFARGGHPALAARKIGGFFDTWGMDDSPEWSFIGYMRYRSRRDLAILVCDPRFSGAHDFKYAAMPQTFNFPTRPMIMTLASPKVWVALALALVAALAQIALLLAKGS
jgi:hypothetical protein